MATMLTILDKYPTRNIRTEEKHLSYLYLLDFVKENCTIKSADVSNNIRLEYLSDFYGLLTYLNIDSNLHYLTLLLNGYNSSNEYNGKKTTIYFVDQNDSQIRYIMEKINTT